MLPVYRIHRQDNQYGASLDNYACVCGGGSVIASW